VRSAAAPPAGAPRQYVQALFDDYAADFQGHLVDRLGYSGPAVLLRSLLERATARGQRFATALDLGCGTGLCAPLLKPHCDTIVGVDLSTQMLQQAAKLGLYDELVQADIGDYLAATPLRAELVVAADVLIYIGDLSRIFHDVARVLEHGGLFAFTVELPTNGQALQLLPSLRYAHAQDHVRACAAPCALQVDELRAAPIRHEHGQPVAGLYATLRRP